MTDDGSSPEEVEASWIAEAKRRLAEYQRGESTPIDLEDVMRELGAEVKRRMAALERGDRAGGLR